MNVSEKIKARIEFLKSQIRSLERQIAGSFYHEYESGKIYASEEEIDFLVQVLDEIENEAK